MAGTKWPRSSARRPCRAELAVEMMFATSRSFTRKKEESGKGCWQSGQRRALHRLTVFAVKNLAPWRTRRLSLPAETFPAPNSRTRCAAAIPVRRMTKRANMARAKIQDFLMSLVSLSISDAPGTMLSARGLRRSSKHEIGRRETLRGSTGSSRSNPCQCGTALPELILRAASHANKWYLTLEKSDGPRSGRFV